MLMSVAAPCIKMGNVRATLCRSALRVMSVAAPINDSKRRKNYDVVIVGGGAIGSSIAMHLSKRAPHLSIAMVERDCSYKRASTVLSIGNIRTQFSNFENCQMTLYGAEFFRNVGEWSARAGDDGVAISGSDDRPTIDFHEDHYLFLASSERAVTQMIANHEVHNQAGCKTQLLSPSQIKERFPWLNCHDVLLGSLGLADEGWFDPYLLLTALSKTAQYHGVDLLRGRAIGCERQGDKITNVTYQPTPSSMHGGDPSELAPITVGCGMLVNAAGPWQFDVMAMCGLDPLPVERRIRHVFSFTCKDAPKNVPMVVDSTGVYFRREGDSGLFIVGGQPLHEEIDIDTPDAELRLRDTYFEERYWEPLANRVTAFEGVKVTGGWAGFYEYNTFDQNAIIGWHPIVTNLMLCNGFSGHGAMQSPAAGRAVAELIDAGRFETIDLTRFHFERLAAGEKVMEKSVV